MGDTLCPRCRRPEATLADYRQASDTGTSREGLCWGVDGQHECDDARAAFYAALEAEVVALKAERDALRARVEQACYLLGIGCPGNAYIALMGGSEEGA